MAEINAGNLMSFCILGGTSLSFLTYHAYRFDKCRCLIPSRKEWFRCLLTWMLFLSNIFLVIWAAVWAYAKYQLGWIRVSFSPGARPFPSAFFPEPYNHYNTPLVVLLGLSYSLQACLNLEEALYWAHLMKAVRQPHSARPFLKSNYFYTWIGISILVCGVQLSVPWINHNGNLQTQISKELLAGGALEFIVLCASCIVVFRFPRFLADVKASGAGPDVRSRLHFYHELNKIRSFFRLTFTIPLFILGIDGLGSTSINMNPAIADPLSTITVGSLCLVMVISIMLYLPRSAPSSAMNKVMVGQMPPPSSSGYKGKDQTTSAFQLMSLLREGGQLGDVDEDLVGEGGKGDDAPFAISGLRTRSWSMGREEKGSNQGNLQAPPPMIGNFVSPIGITTGAAPQLPMAIRIQIEREVHND